MTDHSEVIHLINVNRKLESNGKPKVEYSFYRRKDGVEVLHGKYITWSESGQTFSEQNYRNGKVEGRTTYWHENGKKSGLGMYHNGLMERITSPIADKSGLSLWVSRRT